jgi:KUP system potassium uptake protein
MPNHKTSSLRGVFHSFGLVFGDIGTSPIYTLTVVFLLPTIVRTEDSVIGVLSLIVWTLVILVTIQYSWLAMSLGKRGEGGTIVLRELLVPLLKSGRSVAFFTLLSFIGISLIVGDGVITPAISILSAVEGLLLIKGFESTSQTSLIVIAGSIAVLLFTFQKKGTERVADAFAPLMLLWFLALSISGISSIMIVPSVIKALNPYYALKFMVHHGIVGFFVLSEVILCATGGEALYADMGHLGRVPIVWAWHFVFIALVLNYLGQGAYLIIHPEAKNVLFEMFFFQFEVLYIPFLILSILATVIASQAMISGMFSIVYQGITTRIMPMFKVEYTSQERHSQIYIGVVNWFLLIAVLYIIWVFRESDKLAAAYGFAVSGTMTFTGVFMIWIFFLRKRYVHCAISVFVTLVSLTFFLSNTYKIPHGGYWSIIIAIVPFSLILLYRYGQRKLYKALQPLPVDVFLLSYNQIYQTVNKINGTALFFSRDAKEIPPYIVHTMFKNGIIYEDNIIVSIVKQDEPFGIAASFKEDLAPGLRTFEIHTGYMEVPDVEEILRGAGIQEKTIFYGVEDIVASRFIWNLFSIIKRLTPNIVQFYKLPYNKLHGVVTRVEL